MKCINTLSTAAKLYTSAKAQTYYEDIDPIEVLTCYKPYIIRHLKASQLFPYMTQYFADQDRGAYGIGKSSSMFKMFP